MNFARQLKLRPWALALERAIIQAAAHLKNNDMAVAFNQGNRQGIVMQQDVAFLISQRRL
ncbi:MAG: hypothetical protein ORN25_08900 [Caulobacteraceae bacterium]|nr:hypothetical protein [Caulobacteraceae bacterium]